MGPADPVSLSSVWVLGIALGLTACTVTCLPFMGTWALGREGDTKTKLYDTGAFLLGRLFSYTVLGILAGALGAWFVSGLASGIGNTVIGSSSLVAAAWLAWPKYEQDHAGCRGTQKAALSSPFLLGISLTLIPCAPLTTLLATCAAGGSALSGGTYGAVFGLGAILTPMLILIPACGKFGDVLRQQAHWLTPCLQYGAAGVMLLLGGARLRLVDESLMVGLPLITLLVISYAHLLKSRHSRPHPRQIKHSIIPIKIIE